MKFPDIPVYRLFCSCIGGWRGHPDWNTELGGHWISPFPFCTLTVNRGSRQQDGAMNGKCFLSDFFVGLPNLARLIECFPNTLGLFHMSILQRAHRKCSEKEDPHKKKPNKITFLLLEPGLLFRLVEKVTFDVRPPLRGRRRRTTLFH